MESPTHPSWIDPFTVWLISAVAIAYVTDFLIGKSGRARIQKRLEDAWLKLQNVTWFRLGFAEARSFVLLFDRVFGAKLFSWRRLISCAVLYCISVSIFYALVETVRYYHGLPWRPPFTGFHMNTGFPAQLFPLMVYMSITRYFTDMSIRWLESKRHATIKFLFFLAVFNTASYILVYSGVSLVPERIFTVAYAYSEYVIRNLELPGNYVFGAQFWKDYFIILVHVVRFKAISTYDWAFGTNYLPEHVVLTPHDPFSVENLALYNGFAENIKIAGIREEDNYSAFFAIAGYTLFLDYVRVFIRLTYGIIFIGSWVFLRPLHWFTSLLLLRFAEAERGVLSLVATAVAWLMKTIQMITPH